MDDQHIYAAVGEEGFNRLVAAFYRQVPGDDILGPMYPAGDLPGAEQRLRDFLVGRFGGPQRYVEQRGHPRLRMRHMPFAVNAAARARWMQLMANALDEVRFPEDVDALLREFFDGVSAMLLNRPADMKKTLADLTERAAIQSRLQALAPDSPRQWGRMTPHQAMCHMTDSFNSIMGPAPMTSVGTWFTRVVIKWIALQAPMQWPHGVKTRPEVDQEIGGTRPVEFGRDKRALEAAIDQFARCASVDLQAHPMFGSLTTAEWQLWAYLCTPIITCANSACSRARPAQ